jgi:ABC-type transport system substrate-binding protein
LKKTIVICFITAALSLSSCDVLNSPYPKKDNNKNIFYTSFSERPKTLDPAKAYSSNEYQLLGQIYEPPLQYDYLKRPYQLVPLTAKALPKVTYLNKDKKTITSENEKVFYSLYDIYIKPNIFYAPHPAFAKDEKGYYRYHYLSVDFIEDLNIKKLSDFQYQGTRELRADDYIYQIKRLADSRVNSPIFSLLAEYIVGFKQFSDKLKQQSHVNHRYDIRMEGVKKIDDTHYQILIKVKYPQFNYWLAMPFFSPIPWEAITFYEQPGFEEVNLNLSWFPIGTGPYKLAINDPNRRMVLIKNKHFHPEFYPSQGSKQDQKLGLLAMHAKRLPFMQKIVFVLEKESIPRWNKFLQGYYDTSGISADSFDQAVRVDKNGKLLLTNELKDKKISLYSATEPSIFYLGFNMLDKTVGGLNNKAVKLRQAISIAIDFKEYISIFMNGRGIIAEGPIPPGIDGHQKGKQGINPYIDEWANGSIRRKNIDVAKQLMREAGYPGGIDLKTNKPLLLNYDVPASNSPDDKALFNWYRKQLQKIGISLNIRATQYNRFQEKMSNGNAQLFSWGWHADYPSPENFLFLLYGPNGKVKFGGENAANYQNPQFDRLFNQFKTMEPGPKREQLIKRMIAILQKDSPWVWGVFPKTFMLAQSWNGPIKLSTIGHNTLKYQSINPRLRSSLRKEWNQPVLWPLWVLLIGLFIFLIPIIAAYYRREMKPITKV